MIEIIVIGIIGIIGIIGLFCWKIGESEMGVPSVLGRVLEPLESGLRFTRYPRPFVKMLRFPTTQMELPYEVENVLTMTGWYYKQIQQIESLEEMINREHDEGKKEEYQKKLEGIRDELNKVKQLPPEERKEKAEYCNSVIYPKIQCIVFLRYSKEELHNTIKGLGVVKKEELQRKFKEFVEGCVRAVIGVLSWRAVEHNRAHVEKELLVRLTQKDSPFVVAGFRKEKIFVALTQMKRPSVIEEAIMQPEIEKFAIKSAELRQTALKEELKGYPDGTSSDVAVMLLKNKIPTVIKIESSGGSFLETGLQIEMGRQMAQRMPAGRRSWEPGEEKPEIKKKEKKKISVAGIELEVPDDLEIPNKPEPKSKYAKEKGR